LRGDPESYLLGTVHPISMCVYIRFCIDNHAGCASECLLRYYYIASCIASKNIRTHTRYVHTHTHIHTHSLQTSGLSQGGGSSSSLVSRRSGSMASMSGGYDMVYLEVKSKAQHPLFKLRRQQWYCSVMATQY
jgi:hypothetical protein